MSLCVSIFPNPKEVIVAADTRKSIKIDDKCYALDDNCNKLYVIHGKLIFMCGMYDLCLSIVSAFRKQNNGSIEKLKSIAMETVDKYLKERKLSTAKKLFLCNLLVFYYDQNCNTPVVYNFNSEQDFQISKYDYYLYWCHGAKCDEAKKYIIDNIETHSMNDLFFNIYHETSSEEIGGSMTVYRVNEKGVSLIDRKLIPDKRKIARLSDKRIESMHGALANWAQITDRPSIPIIPEYIKSTFIDSANVISPNITGGTVTGSTVRTGISGTERMEFSGTGLVSYNDSNQRKGISISTGNYGYSDLAYNIDSTHVAGGLAYNAQGEFALYTSSGVNLRFNSDNYINITSSRGCVFAGDVDFSQSNVSGLDVVAKFG